MLAWRWWRLRKEILFMIRWKMLVNHILAKSIGRLAGDTHMYVRFMITTVDVPYVRTFLSILIKCFEFSINQTLHALTCEKPKSDFFFK